MNGFTLVEVIITLIIFLIVSAMVVVLLSGVYRQSMITYDRISVQDELAQIDALIRKELLKAGPTIEGLSVLRDSIEFYAVVPFSKPFYGTYASATKLKYKLTFSQGKLELEISDGASYTRRTTLGLLQKVEFERRAGDPPNVIRYTLEKKNLTLPYRLTSSVVLYNLK